MELNIYAALLACSIESICTQPQKKELSRCSSTLPALAQGVFANLCTWPQLFPDFFIRSFAQTNTGGTKFLSLIIALLEWSQPARSSKTLLYTFYMAQPRPDAGFSMSQATHRKEWDGKTHLEQVLCFCLLFKHRLEHIVHLLGRGILAVACPNAGDQDKLLHPRLCRLPYKVDVTLQRAQLCIKPLIWKLTWSHLDLAAIRVHAAGMRSKKGALNVHDGMRRKNPELHMGDAHAFLSTSSRPTTQAWLHRASQSFHEASPFRRLIV